MRAILVAVSLLSLALSGCAGLSSTEVVEPETVSESFSAQPEVETPEDVAKAVEKIEAVVEEATHEEEEPAKPVWTPVQVTQILTTPFTAPNDVLVDSKNTEHALLSLWATSDGLRCISEPHEETRAVPGGFLAAGEWSSCTIRAEGINLTHHQAVQPFDAKPNSCLSWRLTGTIDTRSMPNGSLKRNPGSTVLTYLPNRNTTPCDSAWTV